MSGPVPSHKVKEALERPLRDSSEELAFFDDLKPEWEKTWWGLPAFEMGNAGPSHRLTVNFLTAEDFRDFQKALGVRLSRKADSMWYPRQERLRPKEYVWRGTPSRCRFPVYVPSKGRADCATTPALLDQAGVRYRLVVEPQEAEAYRAAFGKRPLEE